MFDESMKKLKEFYAIFMEEARERLARVRRIVILAIGGVMVAVIMAFIFGLLVKWLWNWIMPGVFGLPVITFWQAWGLFLLMKILFGGSRPSTSRVSDNYRVRKKIFKKKLRSKIRDWLKDDPNRPVPEEGEDE